MEAIKKEHDKVWNNSKQSKTVGHVDDMIRSLQRARDAIAEDPNSRQITLAKLQNPVKSSFDGIFTGLKDTHGLHNKYTRALDKVFKDKVPSTDIDALSAHPTLINRAIYLHLLREGLFDVASAFHSEALERQNLREETAAQFGLDVSMEHPLGLDQNSEEDIQEQFSNMYHILSELRDSHNLQPAIDWARSNASALEARGSNLEFELCRLQFVNLFMERRDDDGHDFAGPMRALQYAQTEFQSFRGRYLVEIQQLIGAIPFCSNLDDSPYSTRFNNSTAWEEVATSFTREFCSLLELSADSPLYVAATAGAIALPTLMKLQTIQKQKRTEWTSQNELPVETPLPPSYRFHSIFVCPVSKEQTTDQNPPMMLPCCHVIAQESLQKLSKGAKFKCPYCPVESHPKEAKRVFL
ncbi:CTLH/CRA C-terminal to lish motif domain-containing protein [Exophiala viscosa]|uniref:Protein FYV10 n=1 Tax=Exophiala viscosa TaxID=2486360 RepID=A0AAN6DLJ1_9EURO|nr:CTLH/CRA C-terminal to lish motif domain-containing protein [Exophiala viscosa]